MQQGVWVVVPMYNEAAVVADVLRDLLAIFPNVVVVDDGSSDGSAEVVGALPVHLLHHPVNLGQGAALQTGITYALSRGADYVATFDSDGQMSAADLASAADALSASGRDVCLGTRFSGGSAPGIPFSRRVALSAALFVSRVFFGGHLTDLHNGLRIFRRTAAGRIQIRADGMAHATEIVRQIRRLNLTVMEFPVTIRYTDYSLKKGQRTLNAFNILWDLLFG